MPKWKIQNIKLPLRRYTIFLTSDSLDIDLYFLDSSVGHFPHCESVIKINSTIANPLYDRFHVLRQISILPNSKHRSWGMIWGVVALIKSALG